MGKTALLKAEGGLLPELEFWAELEVELDPEVEFEFWAEVELDVDPEFELDLEVAFRSSRFPTPLQPRMQGESSSPVLTWRHDG